MVIITKDVYEYDFETRSNRYVCTVHYDDYYDKVYRPSFVKDMKEVEKRLKDERV